MKNKHFVAFCTDERAIQDIGVCMESLFSTNPYPFEIFILHSKSIEKDGLKEVAKKWKQKLNFIKVNPAPIKKLPLSGFWVEEAYYRLLIPKYLPDYVEKLLYLDTDTLVVKDIRELFQIDLSNHVLSANAGKRKPGDGMEKHEDFLGIKRGTYFGSGIMLLNLRKIREEKLFDKLIAWGIENPTKFTMDQDLLNKFFSEYYVEFGDEYNCWMAKGYKSSCDKDKARIVHLNGKYKGGSHLNLHPLRKEYLFYLERTPWKGNYEKFTMKRWILRNNLLVARIIKNSALGKFILNK